MAADSKPENSRARKPLTQDRLKEVLSYDLDSGVLRWRVNIICGRGRVRVRAGEVAGSIKRRRNDTVAYRIICIDYRMHKAHRLAWMYAFGDPVPVVIDHIDHDGLNNRISNLRAATHSQNLANRGATVSSSSGIKGVTWYKRDGLWKSQIKVNYKNIWLGTFTNIEDAASAYGAASKKYFGEFARTR